MFIIPCFPAQSFVSKTKVMSPTIQLKSTLFFSQQSLQFSQGGEQSSVGLVLLEVVVDGLNDRHVIVKVSRPLTDQRRKTLCGETQRVDNVSMHVQQSDDVK